MTNMEKISNLAFDLLNEQVDEFTLIEKLKEIHMLSLQPQLNEQQQILLTWLNETECETEDPLEPISDLFLEANSQRSSEFKTCLEATYSQLTMDEKLVLIQEYFRQMQEQKRKLK